MDPDPDLSSKNSRKNLPFFFLRLFIFENDSNVASKSNNQQSSENFFCCHLEGH
jgi:hypothetical protein